MNKKIIIDNIEYELVPIQKKIEEAAEVFFLPTTVIIQMFRDKRSKSEFVLSLASNKYKCGNNAYSLFEMIDGRYSYHSGSLEIISIIGNDGEVFTIGDKICWHNPDVFNESNKFKIIKEFRICEKELTIGVEINDKIAFIPFSGRWEITKFKQKSLFKTLDDVDIYKGDTYFFYNSKDNKISKVIQADEDKYKPALNEIIYKFSINELMFKLIRG